MQQGQYDFIMNPAKPPKKSPLGSLLPSGGSSLRHRLLVVVAGGGLLLVILFMVSSFIFKGSGSADDLVAVALQQTELMRVADIGSSKAHTADALNLARTTKLTISSQQQTLLPVIKSQGRKLEAKDLNAGKNAETDRILSSAEQSNQFDEVFISTLQTSIANYQKALKKAYDNSSSTKIKQTLDNDYAQAKLLL